MHLEIKYVDEILKAQYQSEKKLKKIMTYATFIAIFVACLGLFGLASFLTNQRTKEIGIRKVLGASVAKIIAMLSKEFVKWVLIANLIAWPIAWYAINQWLQNFVYRIDVTIWPFLSAGLAVLMIGLLTISFRTIRAATENPVNSLKYE